MVARFPGRQQGLRGRHAAGGLEQACLPPRHGRDPHRQPGARAGGGCEGRQGELPGAWQGAGHHRRQAPRRPARRQCRGGAGRRRPGAAGADAQRQLEAAGRHAAAPRLGRGNVDRADGDRRPPPLRPQGRAHRRRRRPWQPHARAARHAAAVESARAAGCAGPGQDRGAAERRADQLPHRRRGRRRHRPVRHRRDQRARHAGLADHQRPAAAGARGRPVPRHADAAQHHPEADEGGTDAARHPAGAEAPDARHSRRRGARGALGRHCPAAAGAHARRGADVGDRGARHHEWRARRAQAGGRRLPCAGRIRSPN